MHALLFMQPACEPFEVTSNSLIKLGSRFDLTSGISYKGHWSTPSPAIHVGTGFIDSSRVQLWGRVVVRIVL
jgi:hypothetical protein